MPPSLVEQQEPEPGTIAPAEGHAAAANFGDAAGASRLARGAAADFSRVHASRVYAGPPASWASV
jgi:hypothetical protein